MATMANALRLTTARYCKGQEFSAGGSMPALVSAADFSYTGSFLLPLNAAGWSTGFCTGILDIKAGKLYADTHIHSNGLIYEGSLPGTATTAPFPQSVETATLGDIYGGLRNGTVNDVRWDTAMDGWLWTCGINYATTGKDLPSLGIKRSNGSNQSWQINGPYGINSHWARGGTIRIPQTFANAYTSGKTLAIGFGGYYSIIAGGSRGPCLLVIADPTPGDTVMSTTPLLGYGPWGPGPKCPRPPDYFMGTPSEGDWLGVDPVNGQGTWTAGDEVGGESHAGACAWIDLPDKHGLCFWVSHGIGRISYDLGTVTTADRADRLYVYDPADLALVAQGSKQMHEPLPTIEDWLPPNAEFVENPVDANRVGGVHFDAGTRTLYVMETGAYRYFAENYPVVHLYHLN